MYTLTLTPDDLDTIAFVGHRYAWSDALAQMTEGANEIREGDAWTITQGFDADTEGGHSPFPMLDPASDLYDKLAAFWKGIV